MSAAGLTVPTVRYLFASTWAPAGGAWTMAVPGALVHASGTAGNLLNLAFWSLGRQGLIEIEQIRPVQKESVVTMGGRSFTRFKLPYPDAERPGLEGALLAAARDLLKPHRGRDFARRLSRDDPAGLRGLIYSLDLHDRHPWNTVSEPCFAEAAAAGLVGKKGRFIRKLVVLDPAGIESLRDRDAEIVAERTAYREAHGDFDEAVIHDCFAALNWAHTPGGSAD